MRYFIKAATVGKGILFLLLAGLCIPSAAQKRLAVEAEHFRIEWQEKSDGYRISTVSTNSASGRISLENPSGSYGFLYSATKPDTVSLYETMPDYVRKFPGREYTLLYGRWRDNLRPVAMNTAGELVRFYPASAMQKGDSIIFTRKTRQGTLQAVWRPSKQFGSDIEVTMTLRAAVDGYFSLITPTLATLSEKEMAWGVIPGHFQGRKLEPNFVWSYGYGQGIPDRPVVVRERTATTLCPTLTDRQGLSFAVIPEPGQGRDPWTYDHSTQNEWRLGFSLMNRDRELTPSAYHPVLGQEDSYMRKGEIRTFRFRYTVQQGDWYALCSHAARDIYRFGDFLALKEPRQSLTDRILRMAEYLEKDSTSLWRTFDYRGDTIGAQEYNATVFEYERDAVKNSDYGAMWMLARITGNDTLRRTRLPYARNFKIHQQVSGGPLSGAAAGQYYLWKGGRYTEEWGDYAEPIGTVYYIMLDIGNMLLFNPGDAELREDLRRGAERLLAWQYPDGHWEVAYDKATGKPVFRDLRDLRPTFYGLLVAYRLLGDERYLDAACRGADWFVANAVDEGSFLGVCGDFRFVPDFVIAQSAQALLDLYETTGKDCYRDAALRTARFYTNNIFTHPVPTRQEKLVKGVSREDWQIAQAGLSFEHGGTLGSNAKSNGPILLCSHAGMFVRLYAMTGDRLLLDMARAAAWARDAFVDPATSVASYYWNRMNNGPGRFPHHAWWQVGWIVDYLISEIMMRSDGAVDFPGGFVTPKVGPHKCYGFAAGKIFDKTASLCLPPEAIDVSEPQVDYLCALEENDKVFYVMLLNNSTSDREVQVTLRADRILPGKRCDIRHVALFDASGRQIGNRGANQAFSVPIEACGMTVVRVELEYTEIQAHRGGMGLWPENTIMAMKNAIDLGVDMLELDLMISKDSLVVVSHEEIMSSEYVTKPDGTRVTKAEEASLVLFGMPYDDIRRYDTGLAGDSRYPARVRIAACKPLLSELLDATEAHIREKGGRNLRYNIEIKASKGKEQRCMAPDYKTFTDLCMAVILEKGLGGRVTIQSFDARVLNYLHEKYPGIRTSYLIYLSATDFDKNLAKLNFIPDVYSPKHTFVDETLVAKAHAAGMEILPWTVDDEADLQRLARLSVDGVITNYPDRALRLFHLKE